MGDQPTMGAGHTDRVPFSLELPEVLQAIRRRAILIVASVIICGAAFCVVSMRKPKIYRAVASIVLDPVMPKVLGDGFDEDDLAARGSAEQGFYNTQYNIIRSRAILHATITRLKLDEDRAFLEAYRITATPGDAQIKGISSVLLAIVEVVPETGSRVVRLVVEDFDASRAALIANAICDVYREQSLEGRLANTRGASKWLDERADEFAKRLETSEKALNEFKRVNLLVTVSLEDRKNMTTAGLTALNERLIDTRSKLIALESERKVFKSVNTPDADGLLTGEIGSVPRIAKSAVVGQLKSTLVELERSRADLASRYGERHPNMAAVQNQIDLMRKLLKEEIKLITGTLDNEIAELRDTEQNLRAEMDAETRKAIDLNSVSLEYTKLSREVANAKKTYESLLKRQTETDLSGLLESNFVKPLDTAEPNPYPIRPSVPMATFLGALMGLVLALLATVGGVAVDTTIHTQSDVEDRLRLTFLGLLPAIQGDEKTERIGAGETVSPGRRDLYIVKNPKSSVAECVRSLRTSLLFLGTNKPLKRILLTSAGPSEGKSTAVVMLGTTMALAGNRVVVVDTDLRRPRLHKTFGVSGEVGLTSVLLETSDLDSAIKSTEVHGLDVLPCGPLPPNPAELLHTERLHNLLAQLDARYDRVILDSPPVNVVTDATILSRIADGTIIVVKAEQTTKDSARRAARQLLDVDAKLLGVVLNHVDIEKGGYSTYYYQQTYAYTSDSEKSAEV